jgi:hypothetical protein
MKINSNSKNYLYNQEKNVLKEEIYRIEAAMNVIRQNKLSKLNNNKWCIFYHGELKIEFLAICDLNSVIF